MFPSLRFCVQPADINAPFTNDISTPVVNEAGILSVPRHAVELSARVSIRHRARGSFQFVCNAAVYILRVPAPTLATPIPDVLSQVAIELSAHMDVLIGNPAARVILVARVSPAPGTVDVETEASARSRDLSLLQLTNVQDVEAGEVREVVNAVRGSDGRFVLVRELRSRSSPMIGFEIRYQEHDDG